MERQRHAETFGAFWLRLFPDVKAGLENAVDSQHAAMIRTSAQRFRILDLIVGVAVIAIGLVPSQFLMRAMGTPTPRSEGLFKIVWLRLLVTPPLIAATLAGLIYSLAPPREPLRHLARRPGFLAYATAVVCLVVVCPAHLAGEKYSPLGERIAWLIGTVAYPVGLMVAGAWFSLILNGRWLVRPERSERIGLLIGVAWIVLSLANFFRSVL